MNNQSYLGRILKSSTGILIAVNIAIFLILRGWYVFTGQNIFEYLAMAAPFDAWLSQPWGIITYMLVQYDFLHLLFNMMWLFAFGTILSNFDNDRLVAASYLVAGVFGGLIFLITTSIINDGLALMLGSSASVLGVIAAAAARQPRLELNLVLFGRVQLRWLALVALIICGIAPGLGAPPTLAAHIAGAAAGWLFARYAYRLHSLRLFPKRRKYNFTNVRNQQKRGLSPDEQRELDRLLDIVKGSGYKALGMKQRKRLFELSDKINK